MIRINTDGREHPFSPCGRRGLQTAQGLFLLVALSGTLAAEEAPPSQPETENTVVVTGASQQDFPRIAVQFELRRPDGTFIRDARKDEFRVAEDGKEQPILEFQAPVTSESVPTTIVLVVDRSLSMQAENRMGSLKEAVATFLDKAPEGSRIAVVAFGSRVVTICPFTTDRDRVRAAVDELRPGGAHPVLRRGGRGAGDARSARQGAAPCWP